MAGALDGLQGHSGGQKTWFYASGNHATPQVFNKLNSLLNCVFAALLKAKDGETALFQGISFGKWSVLLKSLFQFSSVQFSRSVVSDSLRPHGLQHARPPCPSPTPRVYPNSCPSSRWCHPAISSSVSPFSCLPSCPGSGSFPVGLFQAQYKSAAATSPVCPQLTPWLSPAHLQLSDQATLPWSHTSRSISFTAVTTAGSCGAFRICWPLALSELSPLFILSFPGGSDNKPSACNVGDLGSIPWWGRFPGEGNGNQFLPGESHGQRSLVGYRPRGRTESDMTEWLHFHFLFFMLESPAPEVANQLHFKEKLFWVAWCNGGKSLQTVRRWDSKQQRLLHYWPGRRSLPCQEGRQGPIPQNSGFCGQTWEKAWATGSPALQTPGLQPPGDLRPGQDPWLQSCETVNHSMCHHLLSRE